jgi:hypothetical protein
MASLNWKIIRNILNLNKFWYILPNQNIVLKQIDELLAEKIRIFTSLNKTHALFSNSKN